MPFTKMKSMCAPLYSPEKRMDLLTSERFNVIDEYKSLSTEEIAQKLKENSLPYAICMQNFISDFNIGSCFRSSNIFGAQEVFYFGAKKIDMRSAVGVNNYTKFNWLSSEEELFALKEKYKFVAVDMLKGSIPINKYKIEPNTLFIIGSEAEGIMPNVLDMCEDRIHIPQRGSCRSINAASAASNIMHYAEVTLSSDTAT